MPDIPGRVPTHDNNLFPGREKMAELIAEVLAPGHFFACTRDSLSFERIAEERIPWEVFRGRLLDPAQSRTKRAFAAWNITSSHQTTKLPATVLSIKYDVAAGELFVMRALPCYAWEGYHAGDNVYLSRETIQLVRELVGRVDLTGGLSREDLREEIAGLVLRAVVGTSRLPLTSVEAPLPAFTLGQLGYFYKSGRETPPVDAMQSWQELIERGLYAEQSWFEKAKLLELVLRAVPATEISDVAARFAQRWQNLWRVPDEILALLQKVFNDVSLSPYTGFVDNALAFVQCLVDQGVLVVTRQIDFLSWLLRQLERHLTAYDLVTFHHAGANYPDALLLDAALKTYLGLVERWPELFMASAQEEKMRLRRRGLRQGWLLRRRYEGYAVPDAPTSPGENARVLPPPFVRVPEEQLTQPGRRNRRLYAGDPLPNHLGPRSRTVLRQSMQDPQHHAELQELGMGTFIERPLGVFKASGEPDQTLLLASQGFSKTVAARHLALLAADPETGIGPEDTAQLRKFLDQMPIEGVPVAKIAEPQRPVVSLADSRRVATDFMFLRTLRRGVIEFTDQFDLAPLKVFDANLLDPQQPWLLARVVTRPGDRLAPLTVFDSAFRKRLELEVNPHQGYVTWGGREYPSAGLRVLRVWSSSGQEHALTGKGIVLLPRHCSIASADR